MAEPTAPDAVPLLGPHALVQSRLREGPWWAVPRLDAVVLAPTPDGLAAEHHHRSQARPDATWVGPVRLAIGATGPASIAWVRGSRPWRPGELHVLVPTADGVVHQVRVAGTPGFTPVAPSPAAGSRLPPAASAFGAGAPGAATRVAAAAAGGVLHVLVVRDGRAEHVRWCGAPGLAGSPGAALDSAPVSPGWASTGVLSGAVTGQPTLLAVGGGLLAVLPTAAGLVAWRFGGGWERLGVVARVGDAAAALVRDGRGVSLLVPRRAELERWTASSRGGWAPAGRMPVTGGTPVASLAVAATALGTRRRRGVAGWLQALVQEGDSVFQLQRQVRRPLRDARGVRHRWVRAGCVRFVEPLDEPGSSSDAHATSPSSKLAQVSGDTDSQPWPDGPRPTLSASGRTAGVRGTDLGVRVEVGGASYLLCGDTHWASRWLGTRDAIARIADEGPIPGLPGFSFHGGPIALRGPATVREYDVPLDSFEFGGAWFLFASSHHFARHQTMGRSMLARAVDDPARIGATRRPLRFRVLSTVSDYRFVNISCQWVDGHTMGLGVNRPVLALWGAGSYRADDLRLAALDPTAIEAHLLGRRRFPPRELGLAFWAGMDAGRPVWSDRESQARPVLPGAFGEVSVRWVAALGRFVLLGMTAPGDPAGRSVWLRVSGMPWGPWSRRLLLFDWVADGMSFGDASRRFIRALAQGDPVGDSVFPAQARSTGGAYAPYFFDARAEADAVVIRYTLSTWNPYQIVLMEHRLGPDDLAALGVAG